jgi:hypothetical protein
MKVCTSRPASWRAGWVKLARAAGPCRGGRGRSPCHQRSVPSRRGRPATNELDKTGKLGNLLPSCIPCLILAMGFGACTRKNEANVHAEPVMCPRSGHRSLQPAPKTQKRRADARIHGGRSLQVWAKTGKSAVCVQSMQGSAAGGSATQRVHFPETNNGLAFHANTTTPEWQVPGRYLAWPRPSFGALHWVTLSRAACAVAGRVGQPSHERPAP